MPERGKLYVFEGPDNSGKTTLSLGLVEYLRRKGNACDSYAFPGCESGTLGGLVYRLHHHSQSIGIQSMTPTSLQMLHVAAHIDAIESRILPQLERGSSVVLDRFWWSTLVYGRVSGANGALLQKMVELEQACWASQVPTAVFLIQPSSPIGGHATNDWKAVSKEYANLAEQEARRYPVWCLKNDTEFTDVLSQIINHIYLGGELQ